MTARTFHDTLNITLWGVRASFDGITYTYNEDGIRTSKTVDGITTKYYLDGTRLIEQSNGTDTLHFNYDRNGEAIGFTHYYLSTGYDDPTMCEYIYVKNAQGDVVGIYNSLGDLKVSYTYDPWGKLLSVESDFDQYERDISLLNPFRYRGYYYDDETGLYYLQSRYYDPEVVRFINADDVDFLGATKTLLSYNAFAYCENDPVKAKDENGLVSQNWRNIAKVAGVCAFIVAIATVGTLVGGPAGAAICAVAWAGSFGCVYGYIVGSIQDYRLYGWSGIGGKNTANYCVSMALFYMYSELGTAIANRILKYLSSRAIKSIDDLLKTSNFIRRTKGNSMIYSKSGGFRKAKSDFNKLKKYANMKDVEKLKNSQYRGYKGRIGLINVVLRSGSKSGEATLEIQFTGKKVIKIRYN